MKITPKQYAQSLLMSVKDKKEKEIGRVMEKFAGILASNNALGRDKEIIAEFIKIWNKDKGIADLELTSAHKLDDKTVKALSDYVVELLDATRVTVTQTEDKSLLGGVVLKYGDKVLDASLKTALQTLKNEL